MDLNKIRLTLDLILRAVHIQSSPLTARKQQSRFREAQLLPTGLLREEVGTLMLSREVLRRQSTEHVYKQPLPHVEAVTLVQEYGEDTLEENLV